MSAFKGTPGPWFAGEQCEVSGWVDIRIPGYSRNPVACATPAAHGDAEARRDAETLANARLIAAAPCLLDALQRLNSATRRYMEERPESDAEWASDEPSVLSIVDAAIAKATGGGA